ncbi:hypothetical protein ENKNEFLB_01113 [Nocardioides aquaticus]|uniref:DUF559 domain-containing protein n=1 Tax=Nocardioides aquaticus TaxID=160826 RepID=A0ABX8EE53_9ACTN|nr:hypothetical protein [Nocardioides aquaticus]QVT78735.1 hypothetical protein ENKNEFLB_01113 [Nocardioides aquaticus]
MHPEPRPRGEQHRAVRALIDSQAGMVARRQLTAHGIDWDHVDAEVRGGRWVARTPRVVSTTTGPLSLPQRRWLAVLHAGRRSMLGSLSAAAALGLSGWERDTLTVWVDDELSFELVPGVRFFRTRRPLDLLLRPGGGLPLARLEPAVLLWAAYDADLRSAHGVLAAVVQQRLTTAERLQSWIPRLRPLRRAASFRSVLEDVAHGSHSRAELDLVDLCRVHRLPLPDRQRPRHDAAGRARWTDAEWDLPDGHVVVLEVDGAFHAEVRSWSNDKQRHRRLSGPGRTVVGCTALELRHEPDQLARDLRILLRLDPDESCA